MHRVVNKIAKRCKIMSLKAIEQFYAYLHNSESLRSQLNQWMYKENDIFTQNIVNLGSKAGFHFRKEEMMQYTFESTGYIQPDGELTDDQLAAVAGGAFPIPLMILAGITSIGLAAGTGTVIVGTIIKAVTNN